MSYLDVAEERIDEFEYLSVETAQMERKNKDAWSIL